MASLWYEALTVEHPDLPVDQIERFAKGGINEFIKYLQRAKAHQETSALRVAWQPDEEAEADQPGQGVWVELCATPGDTERFERAMRKFFADQVQEVYEAGTEEDAAPFTASRSINILDADENSGRLLLDRKPSEEYLLLRPNTYGIYRQIQAMRQLKDKPRAEHLPLLRLLGPALPKDGEWPNGRRVVPVQWPAPTSFDVTQWFMLIKELEGIEEQRDFVRKALGSPDFSILEGPPGSGKTTVICELVMQHIEQGKRVLLCASTHVAVDNVLERLKDDTWTYGQHVLAVRIGDRHKVSRKARAYQLDEFVRTTRKQIKTHLRGARSRTRAQDLMLQALHGNGEVIERVVLGCANLVCGTTIGILQHPDIKAQQADGNGVDPQFDVLIVDEASKTTFQEFLVPALLAKRWVLVGDPLQLSPYVEDDEVAANVRAGLPDQHMRDACLDVFDNARHAQEPSRWKSVAVVSDAPKVHEAYTRQAEAHDVAWVDGDSEDAFALHAAPLILATSKGALRASEWPVDLAVVRGEFPGAAVTRRLVAGFPADDHRERTIDPDRSWEGEVAWRLVRQYEQRVFEKDGGTSQTAERYASDQERLLPAPAANESVERVRQHLRDVQRIALPSVLESLQVGFGRRGAVTPTTLSEGLPEEALRSRHARLTYQRRMHPEISRFPREHVYHRAALLDPADMAEQREWGASPWTRYASRAVWHHVPTRTAGTSGPEAEIIVAELKEFIDWAARNPRRDGRMWEVAVLSFYRAQERLLRRAMQRVSGERYPVQESVLRLNRYEVASVHVCTVDRFQGHEADLVYVSVANRWPTSFLESPNRINVAVTRARYQLVVVGNRHAMEKCRTPVLGGLASTLPYGMHYKTGKKGGRS